MGKVTRVTGIILLCMTLFFSACSKEDKGSDTERFSWENIRVGYDAQPYFDERIGNFAKAENGYYYLSEDYDNTCTYLIYFDETTQKAIPVCNKADCTHSANESCDAVFQWWKDGIGNISHIWYYDKCLYALVDKLDSQTNLTSCEIYQISPDGSKRTKYIELFSADNFSVTAYCHRGYIYVAVDYEKDETILYSVKLEKNAEPKVIYDFKGKYATIADYQAYEKGITFKCYSFEDGKPVGHIKYFDNESGTITDLVEGLNDNSYRIIDNSIYYVKDKELYVYNMDTKENRLLYTFDYPIYLSYDGKYLYGDLNVGYYGLSGDLHYIYVLDLEGKLVDKIKVLSMRTCSFGDDKYLFQWFDLDENLEPLEIPFIKAFDKSQIGTGKQEWIELPNTTSVK
ncbi:MAG: hypothetical protein IJM37_04150 [Lachnospiraceae bacterium]|nr:hypothetical protein [Lachnospiraceae bacterium]